MQNLNWQAYINAIITMYKQLQALKIKNSKRLKFLINLFLFKKIPYIEFAITSYCTLRCKDCANYIPDFSKDKQYFMSFEEFKLYLDNLLLNVKKLHKLVLLGGEPFLNKDLNKILNYALEHPKVRKVKLVTNGTLDIAEDIILTLKKYTKPIQAFSKVRLFISDYSLNPEIAGRIKIDELKQKLKSFGVPVSSVAQANWYIVSSISKHNRTQIQNRKYFLSCPFYCVSVFAHFLFICPRAGFFELHNIGAQKLGIEYLDVSRPITQADYLNFYSNLDFSACDFCNMMADIKHPVLPALQK
ncbi:MAG: radical SAM protein [Elusimicrobiota bacterium]|jgi:organic radical activating enzyme|nr:radical SAM protein [Elusimicrobiota bacterium]